MKAQTPDDFDILAYINPLIGCSNGGNVFSGASLLYDMAETVADIDSCERQGGFTMDGANVAGLSMMHDSGTGGNPNLGNFPIFPYTSCPKNDINRYVFSKRDRAAFESFDNATVFAKPGTFDITLDSGIKLK
jgi:Putative alpha-1,2-mannosidase